MGAKFTGYTDEKNIYISPKAEYNELFGWFNERYPLPFSESAPILNGVKNGEVIAKITLPYTKPQESKFASIHSDPPGISTEYPAIIEGKYGEGSFVWSAMPIEAIDFEEYNDIFINFVYRLLGNSSLSFLSTAPDDVEITLFEDENNFYVNAIHLNERAIMPDVLPFRVKILCNSKPQRVELLPCLEEIPFEMDGNYVSFYTKPMHIFSMYRIIK